MLSFALKVRDLLSARDRRRILLLLPAMMLASLADVAVVASAAGYFSLLGRPELMHDGGRIARIRAMVPVDDDGTFMVVAGFGVLAVMGLGNLFAMVTLQQVARFTWSQVASIGELVLSSYLHQPYAFFLTRSVPDLQHRLLDEVRSIVRVLVHAMQVISRSVGALMIIGWLLFQDLLLSLILLSVLGGVFALLWIVVRRRLFRLGRQKSRIMKLRSISALESLQGVKEIKVSGLEGTALARFREPSLRLAQVMAKQLILTSSVRYGMETIAIGGLVVMVIYFQVADRPMVAVLPTIGTYAIAAYRLMPTIQTFFSTMSEIRFETHALELLHADAMAAPPPMPSASLSEGAIAFETSIDCVGVSFSYPTSHTPVVRELSLQLRRGSWTALVGSTGSGKTTLVDLLMGLLQPDSGELCIDGVPLRTREQVASWQRRIGYVPQTIFMNDDTIAKNIAFGEGAPDMDRVRRSARLASAAGFIEGALPDGFETGVGDRGLRLSGGQRQRLGIARALYRRPDLLVLDEATSALDNQTEAEVMHSLREHHASTTVVMIAHRLSTTRYCDQIVVLDLGRVVESGTYTELMERGGRFLQMVQASEESVPVTAPASA